MLRMLILLFLLTGIGMEALAEVPGRPIPIGVVVSVTSDAALFGKEQAAGAMVAMAYCNARGGVNGTPVRLILEDGGGDEAKAGEAFRTLIDAGVLAIVGPTLSQQAFAADPLAVKAGVPVVAPSNTAKGIVQIGKYVSRVSAPMAVVAPNSVKKALSNNPSLKRAALLYARNDAFSVSEASVFQNALKASGLETVALQTFQTTDTDFRAQVQAVLSAKADMAVISGLAVDSGNLVKQLRQSGFDGVIVGGNGLNSPNMFPVCGPQCEGVLVAQAYNPQADFPVNKEFVSLFEKSYHKQPGQFPAQAFTAVQVIVEALNRVVTASGKAIPDMPLAEAREALNTALRRGPFLTPLGEISLDAEGEVVQRDFFVSSIQMNPDGRTGAFVLE